MAKSTKFNTVHPDDMALTGPDGCGVSRAHPSFYEGNGFTMIPNWLIDSQELKPNASLILMTIMRNKPGFDLWDSRMMQRLQCGRDAFYKAIDNLAENGFIKYEYSRGSKGTIESSERIIAPKPIFEPIIKTKRGTRRKKKGDDTEILETSKSVNPSQTAAAGTSQAHHRDTGKPEFGKPVNNNKTTDLVNNTNCLNNTKLNKTQRKNLMVNEIELDVIEAWEDFYELWKNHKVDKAESLEAFKKALKEDHYMTILQGAREYRRFLATTHHWQSQIGNFRTKRKQSSSWLNAKRYKSEYPTDEQLAEEYEPQVPSQYTPDGRLLMGLGKKRAPKADFLSRLEAEKSKREERDITPQRPLLEGDYHD